jgi:hypothetical protein
MWCRVPFQTGTKGDQARMPRRLPRCGEIQTPQPRDLQHLVRLFDGPNFWHVRANLGTRYFNSPPPASTSLEPMPRERIPWAWTDKLCSSRTIRWCATQPRLSQRAILLGILMRANPLQLEGRSAHREVAICAASKCARLCTSGQPPARHTASRLTAKFSRQPFLPSSPSSCGQQREECRPRFTSIAIFFPFTIPRPSSFLHSP